MAQAVSWPSLTSTAVNVGFVVNEVTFEWVFFQLCRFLLVCIIPPMLPTHLLIYHRRYSHLSFQVNTAHESSDLNSMHKPNSVYIVHTR